MLWRREGLPPAVFLPGESHGQRSLVGRSPWGHRGVGHDRGTHAHTLPLLLMSPASYTWRLRAVAACIPAVCSVKACNTVVFGVFPAFPAVQPSARSVSERFLSPGRHPFSLSSHPHRHPQPPALRKHHAAVCFCTFACFGVSCRWSHLTCGLS